MRYLLSNKLIVTLDKMIEEKYLFFGVELGDFKMVLSLLRAHDWPVKTLETASKIAKEKRYPKIEEILKDFQSFKVNKNSPYIHIE